MFYLGGVVSAMTLIAIYGKKRFNLVAAMHFESLRRHFFILSLIWLPKDPYMSRRNDYTTLPTGEQSLQDDEAISANGEGDEEMEDAVDQEEGYSAYTRP